ncbi:MAG: enoyl-CoA hydratase/isomerase family protein [Alphaproteobacteria bacterium]|nr:enoyl-CoA hydratase/isomerase family protein [Alphaproteobacteria bacterium]
MKSEYLLLERNRRVAVLTIRQPETRNALSVPLLEALFAQLSKLAKDETVGAVVLRGSDGAFSSGGNLRDLHQSFVKRNPSLPKSYYQATARLAALLENYAKPFIVLVDGHAISAGAALALHASHAIVSENARFSFPETGLGIIPAAGVSYHLARLPGMLGTYLAMSGAEIVGGDAVHAGLADTLIPGKKHDAFLEQLFDAPLEDASAFDAVRALAESFAEPPAPFTLKEVAPSIAAAFSFATTEECFALLTTQDGEWQAGTLRLMHRKSPLALKAALRTIRAARRLDKADSLKLEFRVAMHLAALPDYREGLRAATEEKGQPLWKHDFLESVSAAELDALFSDSEATRLAPQLVAA